MNFNFSRMVYSNQNMEFSFPTLSYFRPDPKFDALLQTIKLTKVNFLRGN